jgi:hypothetical protein
MGIVSTKIQPTQSNPSVTRAMFGRLFDFAGLFPPAGQSMPEAIATFARHQQEPFAWMLNRFVLPANRIQEFVDGVQAWQAASSPSKQAVRWPLSILSTNWSTDEAAVRQTIASAPALAASMEIESVEQKSMMAEPSTLPIYVELPVDANLEQNLEQVKKSGGLAKLRSGGLTPAEFPSSSSVVRFLSGVQTQQMGMKATAGLHHPSPAMRPASQKPDALVCPMHGFVPFILAACVLERTPSDLELARQILEDQDTRHIAFHETQVHYRDQVFQVAEVEAVRSHRFHAIGSCSFEEPIADLLELGWLKDNS